MSEGEAADEFREVCWRCHKAASVCVCADIPRLEHDTAVHIVQHPRERHHPVGSLRFAELGLAHAQVHVAHYAEDESGHERLQHDFVPPPGSCLVYPGAGARPLESLDPPPSRLVFLDGTWNTVKGLLRDDPRLAALPRVALPASTPQRYRIRREPRDECMSTLEAIVRALSALEPTRAEDFDRLLSAFDAMIDTQIEIVAARGRPRFRPDKQAGHRVPSAFFEAAPRLVLAVVETTQINRREAGNTRARRELVRLSALRLDDGAVFDAWIRPEGAAPNPVALSHMWAPQPPPASGLGPEARALDAVAHAWREFAGARGRVAWNQVDLDLLPERAPDLVADLEPTTHATWGLKGLVARALGARGGALQDACTRAGIEAGAARIPGRNGRKLAQSEALIGWLLAGARAERQDERAKARGGGPD